jgi:hypothetical protein
MLVMPQRECREGVRVRKRDLRSGSALSPLGASADDGDGLWRAVYDAVPQAGAIRWRYRVT